MVYARLLKMSLAPSPLSAVAKSYAPGRPGARLVSEASTLQAPLADPMQQQSQYAPPQQQQQQQQEAMPAAAPLRAFSSVDFYRQSDAMTITVSCSCMEPTSRAQLHEPDRLKIAMTGYSAQLEEHRQRRLGGRQRWRASVYICKGLGQGRQAQGWRGTLRLAEQAGTCARSACFALTPAPPLAETFGVHRALRCPLWSSAPSWKVQEPLLGRRRLSSSMTLAWAPSEPPCCKDKAAFPTSM